MIVSPELLKEVMKIWDFNISQEAFGLRIWRNILKTPKKIEISH